MTAMAAAVTTEEHSNQANMGTAVRGDEGANLDQVPVLDSGQHRHLPREPALPLGLLLWCVPLVEDLDGHGLVSVPGEGRDDQISLEIGRE